MNLSIPIIFFLIPFFFSCVGDKQSKIIRPDKKEIHDSSDPNIISFKAVGDTILGTNFPENRLIDNTDKLFANVLDLLQGSDLLFANYEATLTEYPKSSKDPNRPNTYAFRAPPEYAEILKKTGFDVLSVVNNHSFDFTETGFIDTMNHINNAGMLAVGGKNQIQYTIVKGIKISFIGFGYQRYHNSINDFASAERLVKEAVGLSDIVVVSIHAGAEGPGAIHVKDEVETFLGENRGNIVQFSHKMIDLGVDLVLGHGPHVPRAMELYKDRLVAYSMGNFLGYRTLSAQGLGGYSMILQVSVDNQGRFLQGNIIPILMKAPGIPYPDPDYKTIGLVRKLIQEDFPFTSLELDEMGNFYRSASVSWK